MSEPIRDSADGYASLVDLLRFRASTQAEREGYVFLVDGQTPAARLTYAHLDRQARALAVTLLAQSAPGDRALLLYPPGLDFFVAFYGCLSAGIIGIPAPPPDALRLKRTLPRLQSIAEDAKASLVLTTTTIQERLDEYREHVPSLGELRWLATESLDASPADSWEPPVVDGSTLAYLQYTSGSTSTPRGVMVSHRNLLVHSQSIREGCGYTADSVTVTWLPHFHDYGLIQGLLQPLYSGHLCVVMSPLAFLKRPIRWLEAIQRYHGTHSMGPNFAFDLCVKQLTAKQRESLHLSSWRYAGNGAEPIHADTIERFLETFAPCGFRREAFSPAYGLAEATLVVSSSRVEEAAHILPARAADLEQNRAVRAAEGEKNIRSVVSCGKPMPGRTVVIAEPQTRRRCADGEVGEIWVSDAGVAEGYWGRPVETDETFHARIAGTDEGPFLRTGDLGFLLDGEVYVTGRYKDLIIIAGSNHYPQDIERTVENCHAALRKNASAAFSIEVEGEERLVVVAEMDRSGGNAEEVLAAIRQAILEGHEVEAQALSLLQSGSVLKTSSGKIQRRGNRSAFLEGSLPVTASWTRPIPARRASEEQQLSLARRAGVEIRDWLVGQLASRLGVSPSDIHVDTPLSHLGLVSREAVALIGALEDYLGKSLSPVLVYQYPTITLLARHLSGEEAVSPLSNTSGLRLDAHESIAVVGLGCRFPGAANPEAFWRLLRDGVDAVSEVPADRWDAEDWFSGEDAVPGKMSTRWGGFLDEVDGFDAAFFGLTPAEACSMDPQQRLLLEVAWEALEHAGIIPSRLAGTAAGVFVGISTDDYARLQFGDASSLSAYAGTGSALSIAANRISYILDLRGPSLVVDTACSSSLVAVHLAMDSLRQGRADLALAGGVNLILSPEWTVTFSQARMMSPTGRCRTFDASADGYVRGEGCGIVVLKRLSDALRDGDNILAILRGSAINQDGRSNGLTAPNPLAQQHVIRLALRDAGVEPSEIGYVETHGTGTPLGDPIEVQALAAALGEKRDTSNRLLIGSVKTNLGHLESAAGIAGLIKVVLGLSHGELPAMLHFQQPNPLIPWQSLPLSVVSTLTPWDAERRFAGVSSFGFGGTNAHLIVEAPHPGEGTGESPVSTGLLTLSAKAPEALRAQAGQFAAFLEHETSLGDVCRSARRREIFSCRLAVGGTQSQVVERLRAFASGQETPGVFTGTVTGTRPKVAFLFTGQGSQYAGMGRQLYETSPSFRSDLDCCSELLRSHLDLPLLDVIYPGDTGVSLLDQTAYTQPALFALEYALARLWMSWGVRPDAVMGHSLGEYVAACLAGVLSLEDAITLVATRARLMQALPAGGAMAAILAAEEVVVRAIAGTEVSLAALNGPENTVIAGPAGAVDAVVSRLMNQGIRCQRLTVSHAFHSALVESMLPVLDELASRLEPQPPSVPLAWNLTGEIGTPLTPGYWSRHARQPVQFARGVRALREAGCTIFVEIGPGTTLLGMARRCVNDEGLLWLPSLRRGQEDRNVLLVSAAQLHVHGVSIESDHPGRFVSLPTYPFQRQRYWLNNVVRATPRQDGLYVPRWVAEDTASPAALEPGKWLLIHGSKTAEALARELQAHGHSFVVDQPEAMDGFRGVVYFADQVASSPFAAACDFASEVLSLVQSLAARGATARLWLVTRGCQSIQTETIIPSAAVLWGLGRVIAREHPDQWGGLIDLPPEESEPDAACLLRELLGQPGRESIIRNGRRHTMRLEPSPFPQLEAPPLRSDATYLITGGLGGLGLLVARYLVEKGVRPLFLVGRRAPTDAALEAIRAMEQAGAQVRTMQADVSRREDVERLLAEIAATMPPLAGIIHAAGVLDDGILLRQDRERFEKVLAAKVAGGWNLHELTRELPLDCFVLFSSAAELLGSPGQGSYAAANAFLDALAHHRRAIGLPALSINWGPWAEIGMASKQERTSLEGLTPIAPKRGLDVFSRLLGQTQPQFAFIPGEWQRQKTSRATSDLVRRLHESSEKQRLPLLAGELRSEVSRLLGKPAESLDAQRGFFEIGMDSLMSVELRNRLQARLDLSPPLPASLAFDHPTIDRLAAHLLSRFAPAKDESPRLASHASSDEPIAIVGLGCRFPGADDPDSFWQLLRRGGDAVGEVPGDRWDIESYYDPSPDTVGKMYSRWGGFLRGVDQFDPAFFGISPREALMMDPQQRLLLEVAWESLEHAGIAADRLGGTSTGVFVGISGSDYAQLLTMSADPGRIDTYFGTGTSVSAAAGRIAYLLGLQGPALAVDTACSSSLVALHLACESLRRGECQLALAGGVNLLLSPVASINLSRAHMLAHDSHCKTFDASADGYVRGEGCGVVVLKRLSDARADGDNVLALIRGSAVNQDGRSSGLTAPNGPAQEAVIRQALENGNIEPGSVSYVEAHGTGTPLGDPIEVNALAAVYGQGRDRAAPVLIGSVKTNVGHLEAAAGMAGLIKVVLSLNHGEIPPHLHFRSPNPHIPWQDFPVAVPRALTPWREGIRRAGLSSFGFIGTNAHVVLESPPVREQAPVNAAPVEHLLLSARSESALRELARRWSRHLENDTLSLADVAHTARQGRARFNHRLLIAASSRLDVCRQLAAFAEGSISEGMQYGEVLPLEDTPADPARRRVPLPTYPFQRQRYWPAGLGPVKPAGAREPDQRSIAGRRFRSALRHRLHESRWSTDLFPTLADHRLFGEVVVPGAWHLAALFTALVETEPAVWEIEEITFRESLALESGTIRATQLILRPGQSHDHGFELFSQVDGAAEETWVLHAAARRCQPKREPSTNGHGTMTRPTREITSPSFYRMMASIGIELGLSFRWLDEIHADRGQAVARMRAPMSDEERLAPLHPGMIDSCFQLVAAALASDTPLSQALIPLAIDRVTFHGAGPTPYSAHAAVREDANSGEITVADVTLRDTTGKPVLIVNGLRARRASPSTLLRGRKPVADDCLYSFAWQEAARPEPVIAERRWLIVSREEAVASELPAALTGLGQVYIVGRIGNPAHGGNVLAEGADEVPTDVVFFPERCEDIQKSDALDLAVRRSCEAAIELVQALAQITNPPRLWFLTSSGSLEHAPLIGLARTIALEHPELHCTLIENDGSLDAIARELLAAVDENDIALRDGKRLVARLERLELPALSAVQCNADATYVITGGLGGLGLSVARGLVERGARHLLLIGRRPPSAEALAAIAELQQVGVHVVTAGADVAEYDELGKVLAEAHDSMPPLRGIIHAAGVLDDGVLLEQTPERFERVLAPKVRGAWNLHLLTETQSLDFFVLFSSAASLLGSAGQGNYAAANSFLDALAHHRRGLGLPGLSINWGPWADVGMAALDGVPASRWAGLGWKPLSPARALAQFDALLASSLTQVGVLDVDWERHAARARRVTPLLSNLVRPRQAAAAASAFRSQLDDLNNDQQRERLLEHIRDIITTVLRLTSEQAPGERTRLFELGLDSLMALEVRSRLQEGLGLALPSTLIFDHPTLASVADFLLSLLPAQAVEPQPEHVSADAVEDGLDELSDDELERLLLAKLDDLQRRSS
jgi:acyl transferase domain-containing protein/acyl-CoA synthetase (AMP-forming)/AMP-acid ligase II/acyl carrier protein